MLIGFLYFTWILHCKALFFTQWKYYKTTENIKNKDLKVEINMKKQLAFLAAATIAITSLVGCGKKGNTEITVVSREGGSGTRGAFIELLGIEEKDADGNKVDKTYPEAIIAGKTDIMIQQVSGNEQAIGYISLGSLNDSISAVKVDGVEVSVENIKNGTYKVSRPFNIATKGEATGLAKDFITYIMSKDGQDVVVDNKYISINDSTESFISNNSSGKLVIAGSSSVTPVMEKLKEAYEKINTNATIEIQQSDSSSGMKAVNEGTCDIGMASRELKDSELETLTATSIAMDGIAVIVNKKNEVTDLSSENIKKIFTGEIKKWDDIK